MIARYLVFANSARVVRRLRVALSKGRIFLSMQALVKDISIFCMLLLRGPVLKAKVARNYNKTSPLPSPPVGLFQYSIYSVPQVYYPFP